MKPLLRYPYMGEVLRAVTFTLLIVGLFIVVSALTQDKAMDIPLSFASVTICVFFPALGMFMLFTKEIIDYAGEKYQEGYREGYSKGFADGMYHKLPEELIEKIKAIEIVRKDKSKGM